MLNGFHRGAHPRSLDEVALAALAAGLDVDDTLVDIELVDVELIDDAEVDLDLDVTARFARDSSPYERIEITTIEPAPEAAPPPWRATSWRWIAYSGAAWALALAVWWIGGA